MFRRCVYIVRIEVELGTRGKGKLDDGSGSRIPGNRGVDGRDTREARVAYRCTERLEVDQNETRRGHRCHPTPPIPLRP